jgi:hypothetical protein
MLRLLKRLFGGGAPKQLVLEAYWCESSVRLPAKVATPGGSNVSVVNVCVDIHYAMNEGNIILRRVQLSRGGGRISGADKPINVASERTGEGWFASTVCSDSLLVDAVQQDISRQDSRLRGLMIGKWRDLNRDALVQSLADALNSQAPPDEIAKCISTGGRGNDIIFTYTKPEGGSDIRTVTVQGVSGNSIRAHDHKDGKLKSFRVDRISNARSP